MKNCQVCGSYMSRGPEYYGGNGNIYACSKECLMNADKMGNMEYNELNQFSIEAKIVACSWLIMPGAKKKTISFNRPWMITEKCQKGLDELEQHGYIEKHYRNHYPDCPIDYVATEKLANCQMPLSFEDCKKHSFPFTY